MSRPDSSSMLAFILLLLAALLLGLAWRLHRSTGLPRGRVVYADTGGWGRPGKPLFSPALQLTGKPDYLVQAGEIYIPVEVKSRRTPPGGPPEAHVYQLAAYCLLVAETYGRRPAYGLIRYADQTWAVDFTPALEADLLRVLEALSADRLAGEAHRSHDAPARCRACGFRGICGENLA